MRTRRLWIALIATSLAGLLLAAPVLQLIPAGAHQGSTLKPIQMGRRVSLVGAGPNSVRGAWADRVNSTFDLITGSVLPGNARPADPNSPFAVSYDSSNGQLYVASDRSSGVAIVNATSGRLVNTVNAPTTCCGTLVSDPKDHRIFFPEGDLKIGVLDDQNDTLVANISLPYSLTAGASVGGLVLDNVTDTLYATNDEGRNVTVINASSDTIVGNLSVCSKPMGGTFVSTVSKVFFECWNTGIGVVNASSNTFVGNISNPSSSEASAYDPSNGLVYVANAGSGGNCTLVDPTTDTVVGYALSGNAISALAYDPASGLILTSDQGSGILQAFNGSTGASVYYHKLGGSLAGLALDPVNGEGYVASQSGNNLTSFKVSTGTLNATIRLASNPWGMAYLPATSTLYVANSGQDAVQALDLSRGGETNLSVGSNPMGLVYDNATGRLYAVNSGSDNVSEISLNPFRVTANFPVGSTPQDIAYDPANQYLYVTNPGSDNVTVLNGTTGKQVKSIGVGSHPWDIAYDPVNALLYVTNDYSGSVSVIKGSSNSVTSTISFGTATGPLDLAVDPATDVIAVTQEFAQPYVWFISGGTNTVTLNDTALDQPYGITFDPQVGQFLATQEAWNNASIVNASTGALLGSVGLGAVPKEAMYSAAVDEVFVGDRQSAAISILNASPTAYEVTFDLSGPRPSANWSVGLAGHTHATNRSSLQFEEPNGSYNFTVGAPAGFAIDPASGNLNVSGGPVNESLHIVRTYVVTFKESGLPSQTEWNATVNGTTDSSSTSSINFTEPNGTYAFSLGGVPGWSTGSYRGNVNVSGAGRTVLVNWTQVTYAVEFLEQGLPNGTEWNVTLGANTSTTVGVSDNFTRPNGTYDWNITPIAGYGTHWSGSLTVDGSPVRRNVTFARLTYGLEFVESGLPTGTSWTVSVGGQIENSSQNSLSFAEPNGTYAWNVQPIPGYRTNWTGTATVNGTSQFIPVSFQPVTYPVTFEEKGLAAGLAWTLVLGNTSHTSLIASIRLFEPNGSYSWRISPVPGYSTVWVGVLLVNGQNGTVSVTFTVVTYGVVFSEQGLPPTTPWSVSIGATNLMGDGPVLDFVAPNGTFRYSLGAIPGYTTAWSGEFDVSGSNVQVNVSFTELLYSVIFEETGLRAGTNWTVAIGNSADSNSSATLSLPGPNGTYSYDVTPIPGYLAPWEGEVLVSGRSPVVTLPFVIATYEVHFIEDGLPAGTDWSVRVGGADYHSTGPELDLAEPNGTYGFAVAPPAEFTTNRSSGTVSVAGGPQTVSIQFDAVAVPPPTSTNSTGSSHHTGWDVLDEYALFTGIAAVAIGAITVLILRGRRGGGSSRLSAPDESVPPQREVGSERKDQSAAEAPAPNGPDLLS